MWYCLCCKEYCWVSKKFDFWKMFDIFVVYLKCFSSFGWCRDKFDVFVDFFIEGLDLIFRVI